MEQQSQTFRFVHPDVNMACPTTSEAVNNHFVANTDIELVAAGELKNVEVTCGWTKFNAKLNAMLAGPVLYDYDVRDLYMMMEELEMRNKWSEMNDKIRADLEAISMRVDESRKVLDENPPELKYWAHRFHNFGYPMFFAKSAQPEVVAEPEPVPEPEPVQEPEPVPEPEPVVQEPEPVPEPEPVQEPEPVPEPEPVQEPEPVPEPEPTPAPEPVQVDMRSFFCDPMPTMPMPMSMPMPMPMQMPMSMAMPTTMPTMQVPMSYAHWNAMWNHDVANANVGELFPMHYYKVERNLEEWNESWNKLMEDMIQWRKWGLNRYTVRMEKSHFEE